MTLTAGTASAVITPPVGTAMEGYSARADVSQGVHDDVHARALVVDDGATAVAIVSCDLVGVGRRLVMQARDMASQKTGIPSGNILIAATHTHSGPAGLRLEADDELLDVTARHIAGAIAQAHRGRRPAVLKVGVGSVDSVSMNRRHPDWPADNALFVLLFDDPDPLQPPIAAAINFACHATVLYHTNLLISADYPGHAVRTVEQLFPGMGGLFLNGACGNVNPAWIKQDHPEAERVGKIVGAAAARLIGELRPLGARHVAHNIRWDEHIEKRVTAGRLIENVGLGVASRHVDAPVKSFDPPAEIEASVRELEARAAATSGEEHRRLMEQITRFRTEALVAQRLANQAGRVFHPELMAIAFAPDVALLGLPGEFFVETVAEIRQQAGLRELPVACYANNYIGYVVPAAAYAEGGYEAGVTLLAPEAEAAIKREAIELVREVTSSA
jgi:neutral ceramidase